MIKYNIYYSIISTPVSQKNDADQDIKLKKKKMVLGHSPPPLQSSAPPPKQPVVWKNTLISPTEV